MTTKKKQIEISAMTPEVITPSLPGSEMSVIPNAEIIPLPFPEVEPEEPAYKRTDFYNSHQFVKAGFSEPYKTPQMLLNTLTPFMGETNLILEGSFPVTIAENDEVKTAYARGMIVKSYTLDFEDSITYEVGFLYAYDLATPIFKVFSGAKVRACSNLCIFQGEDIQEFKIMENAAGAYEQVKVYMDEVNERMEQAKETIHLLKNTHLTKSQLTDFYGKLLFNFQAVENIAGITCITESCKRLQKQGDVYYFDTRPRKDINGNIVPATTSCWNVYNCLTDKFAKKAILDQPEKVLSIFREVAPLMTYEYAN